MRAISGVISPPDRSRLRFEAVSGPSTVPGRMTRLLARLAGVFSELSSTPANPRRPVDIREDGVECGVVMSDWASSHWACSCPAVLFAVIDIARVIRRFCFSCAGKCGVSTSNGSACTPNPMCD